MLNSTALNLNNRLLQASASFDNKIRTMSLIRLAKSFIDTPTCSMCMILIPAFCLQTVSGATYHFQRYVNDLFLSSLLYELF